MMGLGVGGIGIGKGGARRGFSLAGLFAGQTGFLPPFTADTLWQDAAGTTPVTTLDHPVAFAQDGSQGLALGPEFATDGGFNTSDSWLGIAGGTTLTVSGGAASFEISAGFRGAYQPASIPVGKVLLIEYTVLSISGGSVGVVGKTAADGISGNTTFSTATKTAPGTYREIVTTATALTSSIAVRNGTAGTTTVIDNISVSELLGNHGKQPGASSFRPLWKTDALFFDGADDYLLTTAIPGTSGTMGCAFDAATASRAFMGAKDVSNGNCYIGVGSGGALAGGIGSVGLASITGGGDLRGTGKHTGVLTWDGTAVRLYLDGVEVYAGAQSGAVTSVVPITIGAINTAGTAGSFHSGRIYAQPLYINRALTAAEVAKAHAKWSA